MNELQDLVALIRANTPLIVIETPDEPRVVALFRQALGQAWRALWRWSITDGLCRMDLGGEQASGIAPDASSTLAAIRKTDACDLVLRFLAERLEFMTQLSVWPTFSKGWARRIAENMRYGAEDTP